MYGMIALKLLIGLIMVIVVVRLIGKKEFSQVTPLDFVYVVILGGLLDGAVFDEKVTIGHVVFALTVWALAIYLFETFVRKYEPVRSVVMGNPSIIIKDGELDIKVFEKSKLELEQLRTLLRQKGIFSLKEVQYAYLETNGSLSVLKYPEYDPATPEQLKVDAGQSKPSTLVVDEGRIVKRGLRLIGKDEHWLRSSLKSEGYDTVKEIYCAEWTEGEGFYIQKCAEE